MQIIKHCKDNYPTPATGSLLGLENEGIIEVTHSFAIPQLDEDPATGKYQMDFLKLLRLVNVDFNSVGWYTSADISAFSTEEFVTSQYNYQKSIGINSIVLIYDPSELNYGILNVKALQLSKEFIETIDKDVTTLTSLTSCGITSNNIYTEIPIRINHTGLSTVFLDQLSKSPLYSNKKYDLNLSYNSYLEHHIEYLQKSVFSVATDLETRVNYENEVRNTIANIKKYQQEKNAEYEVKGIEPNDDTALPPEFKYPTEPKYIITIILLFISHLKTLLVTHQIRNYCDRVNEYSEQSLKKLFLIGNIHK